jgi:anti-sigma factor RsiW
MNCSRARAQIASYHDGELDLAGSLAIEAHLAGCAACGEELVQLRSLSKRIREQAPYHRAPASLQLRLPATPVPAAAAPSVRAPRRWRQAMWPRALAASLLLALAVNGYLLWGRGGADDAVADEVVAGHLRSLEAQHLSDVISTDQHTVKPWFAGKLDYSPPVHDLADVGFPLAGGRLDVLDRQPVAALIYRHRAHIINVFVWPEGAADAVRAPANEHQRGFNLVRWREHGMQWWAVSDLNAVELDQLVSDLRSRDAGGH